MLDDSGFVPEYVAGPGNSAWCPYGQLGDRLWVREAFEVIDFEGSESLGDGRRFNYLQEPQVQLAYLADPDDADAPWVTMPGHCETRIKEKRYPSIYMPRWASRITLEVAAIRIERLQEIREDDAVAEGIAPLFTPEDMAKGPEFDLDPMPWANYLWHGHVGKTITASQSDAWAHQFSSYSDARGSFSSLWQSINAKKHPWESNPWVWVVEFKVVDATSAP